MAAAGLLELHLPPGRESASHQQQNWPQPLSLSLQPASLSEEIEAAFAAPACQFSTGGRWERWVRRTPGEVVGLALTQLCRRAAGAGQCVQEGSDGRCLRLTMPGREEEVGLWRILPGFLRLTHLN